MLTKARGRITHLGTITKHIVITKRGDDGGTLNRHHRTCLIKLDPAQVRFRKVTLVDDKCPEIKDRQSKLPEYTSNVKQIEHERLVTR